MDLRKINNRLWKFVDEEIGEFSPSKFTINRLNNEITVVYFNNLQSKTYNVSDVYVYDVPPATAFNTSNGDELMAKLEELNCPCFQKDETIVIGGAVNSVNGETGDVVLVASDVLDEDNLGAFMDVDLNTKLTPSPNDTILGRDFLTNEAVEFNYPIVEGYFNGTNFYLEAGFINLITATTGRTYIDLSTNLQYRWNGSAYVQISAGLTIPDLQRYSIYAWRPTPTAWYGFTTPNFVGTADNLSPSFLGNDFIKAVRHRRLSASTAGSSSEYYEGSFRQTSVGDGFFFSMKFGNEDAVAVADARLFAGLYGLGVIGNVNPSTLVSMIGVGADSGDANLQFMHNDNGGTAVKVDLGSNFPANTIATDLYCFQMYNVPGASSVWYRLINISTKVETAWVEVTTDLPAINSALIPHCWRNNGTTALAVRLSLVDLTLYKRI